MLEIGLEIINVEIENKLHELGLAYNKKQTSMTVGQLKKIISDLPQDTPVVTLLKVKTAHTFYEIDIAVVREDILYLDTYGEVKNSDVVVLT